MGDSREDLEVLAVAVIAATQTLTINGQTGNGGWLLFLEPLTDDDDKLTNITGR